MSELNMDLFGEETLDFNPFGSDPELDVDGEAGDPADETPLSESEDDDDDIDPDKIFGSAEVVEDKEELEQKSKANPKEPKSKFYSTAVKALKDDGILPDLSDDDLNSVETPEDFASAIEKQVQARLDAKQKRINEALEANVEVSEVKRFENVLSYLDSIDDDTLEDESDNAIDTRRKLIYQDYVNRGFKHERALREVERSFNSGSDVEDAKLARDSNREFYKDQYDTLIETNKAKAKEEKKRIEEATESFKKKVLETEEPFPGLKIDKNLRQQSLDNSSKPLYRLSNGQLGTAVQKYFDENREDAQYKLSILYTMTDGFKNLDKLVTKKVAQEKKSSIRELEHKLKNTPLAGDGSVDFDFGNKDEDSFFSGLRINL